MADQAKDAPAGGSVQQTTNVALPMGIGLVVLQYLVHPVWPPPETILTIAATATAPAAHLIGRAIYRKLASWAGDPDQADTPVRPIVVSPAPPPAPIIVQGTIS